jgi:CTD small phosphatase-like protein 2
MPSHPVPRKLPLAQKPTLIFDLDETLIHCN